MKITFRPLGVWPYEHTDPRRGRSTFKAPWSNTLDLMARELEHLGAHEVVIQADFRESDIRLDGMPRLKAREPSHPGIIISFESRMGPLQYATDAHERWEHNVRAIALGLEALRAVDRYGITRSGEQYQGWRQLTAGNGGPTTQEQALELVGRLAAVPANELREPDLRRAYRHALTKAHPDHGGSTDTLMAVREAGRILGVA